MKILVTGAAGFIGFSLSRRLLADGHEVVGLDNLNPYYDVSLKMSRLGVLEGQKAFSFAKMDVADGEGLSGLFKKSGFDIVVHLAAQAGVRYSIEDPMAYVTSNLVGFTNILEASRHNKIKHLVYASSSSVYGLNTSMPFSEDQPTHQQASFYGATKKSNEVMAHSYSHLYGLPTTGLRFFTVYGPWGRPDMALFLFTKAMLGGKPIKVFNHGEMSRDFTYIDDIIDGVARVSYADVNDLYGPGIPYGVFNIANGAPVSLMRFISVLEETLGKEAIKEYMPMQAGDVKSTFASTKALHALTGYASTTPVEVGVPKFVQWYREYYKV